MSTNTITSLNLHQTLGSILINETLQEINKLKCIKESDIKVSIDKIWILTNHIDEQSLMKEFTMPYAYNSKYYKGRIKYRHNQNNNLSILIFKDSRNAKALFKHKIEINPRHFENFSSLVILLSNLLTPEGLKNHRVTRIDISFCFPKEKVSVDSFNLTTHFKNKHYVGSYNKQYPKEEENGSSPDTVYNKGHLDTAMIGKHPCRISIYDRSKKLSTDNSINFEMQVANRYVKQLLGIEMIQDLPSLISARLLYNVSFKDVTAPKYPQYFYLKKMNMFKLAQVQVFTFQAGFHSARSKCNKRMHRKLDDQIIHKLCDIKSDHNNKYFKKLLIKKFKKDLRDYFDN